MLQHAIGLYSVTFIGCWHLGTKVSKVALNYLSKESVAKKSCITESLTTSQDTLKNSELKPSGGDLLFG